MNIAVVAILACCAACFVGCIEGLVEYFNKYAYIQIALYGTYYLTHWRDRSKIIISVGKPYIAAAKDTWRMIVDRGVDAIINDTIVGIGERL